ncbi:hypothetical protein [Erythrobacter aurantius]|uniref:hypothetical protein n=1 Tax=Erythrobacter aurantius TaxID=2909249 RepID=UPI00207920E2|nr:hypothetical protein [Erythrobacter aurantius]
MLVTVGWDVGLLWDVEQDDQETLEEFGDANQCVALRRAKLLTLLQVSEQQSEDGFLVAERKTQHFMQCLNTSGGWILEKREGHASAHYRAALIEQPECSASEASIVDRILAHPRQPQLYLSTEQVLAAFAAYLAHEPEPDWLNWERMDV